MQVRQAVYRVCSSRAERKKAFTQVEPLRDCCVNVIGIDGFQEWRKIFRNLSGTAGV